MCKLFLFGTPAIECNGRSQPIQRRKAKALLGYLAVTQQSHSREALASLLWPEYDRPSGLADLSRILSSLRKTLGANSFLADRESVALHGEADLWVDVLHFREQLESCRRTVGLDDDCHQKLASAVELYQADFLAGFTLPDCPDFDEWQLLQTEALRRDLGWALEKLVHTHEERNDLAQAIAYAQRWVRVDPLHERAQRQLISLYARNGQRAEAHRQYQVCERLLAEELGVEPQPETKQLYEEIRKSRSQAAVEPPPFVGPDPQAAPHLFVGRTHELNQLDGYLAEALAGNGRIAFVTGGAGRGKTSLLAEFTRRAQKTHDDLIVANGNGSFFAGTGDPFLPFREAFSQLTGDVATRRTGGQIGTEQARRLWAILPQSVQAILEHAPQLLDVFVSGKQLLARASAAAPVGASWLAALQTEVARRRETPDALEQSALFGQFTDVLLHLSQKRPLLITLDDLQWMDQASTGLLFHLGRRLAGSRILVVGAYRQDELSPGRNGEPHPLVQLLNEFKRSYGDIFIDLANADQVEARAFVDTILDIEPNRLGEAFREALFRRTGGHPLFTIELLRDMQSRGDLVQDEAGRWCEGQALDWETFPARVEAVIAGRVDRLDSVLQAILRVACVEGELFSAEVVARVLGMEDRLVLHSLSQQLGNRHRLVRERGEIEAGTHYISSYQFSHALFQQYLYRQLSSGERRRLHTEIAETLAALYADDLDQVIVELAHHFVAAGDWHRSVPYLRRSGDLAYHKASLPDAVRYYESALAHWTESDQVGQAQTMRKLGECMWVMGQHQKAIELLKDSYDLSYRAGDDQGAGAAQRLFGRVYWELGQAGNARDAYQQALTILEHKPESEELAWALAGMATYHMHVGDYDESIELGERALAMARRLGAEAIIIQCLCDLGAARSSMGDWEGLALEQESLDRALASNRPHDAGRAYLYLAEAFKYLGRYEQAKDILEDAIAYTRRMHVPYTVAAAENMLAEVDWLTGRWSTAMSQLEQRPGEVHSEQPGDLSHIYRAVVQGRLYNDIGQLEKAHKILVEALAGASAALDPRVALLGELVRAEAALGRVAPAASTASEILEQTDQVRYLYPNVAMALLTICHMPVAFGWPAMGGAARSAWAQLERLDGQYRTPVTAACRLEGLGWITLVEGDAVQAAAFFRQAQNRWQELGHPYDQARALSGLSRALTQEDHDGFKTAMEQARELVNSLAAQLQDPALRASFLASGFVREIQK